MAGTVRSLRIVGHGLLNRSATSFAATRVSWKHNDPPCKTAVFPAQKLEAKYLFWPSKNGLFQKSNPF